MEAAAPAAADAPPASRAAQVAQLLAFYRRHDETKTLEQIEGIVDKRRGDAGCLGLQAWAALSAAMAAKYGEELPPFGGAAVGGSCGSSSSGAAARTSCGGMPKGVASGGIGKTTRKAKGPSASWVAQDLGVISSLISAHLHRSEGEDTPDLLSAAAAAHARQPTATSGGGGGGGAAGAGAVANPSDARVAVVVEELQMAIADQALGSTSL